MEKLWMYEKERVEVVLKNGKVFRGKVGDYIEAEDNDRPIDSIILDLFSGGYPTEIYENEIESITILK